MTVLDSVGMFDLAEGFPEQVEAAAGAARGVVPLPDAESVEQVVVIGMGASGLAGDILVATAAPQLPVPVVVVKSYECPAFVGEGTLCFAISTSGDTEETVQAATDAAEAGARMVVISSGGVLTDLARSWGVAHVPVPAGFPEPRTALGALAIPPLVVLEEIGLFRGASHWVHQAVEQLQRRRDALAVAGDTSAAADVARRIGRTIPLLHGGGAVGSTAAQRWKMQVNQSAKSPAFWSAQPELCHNEVCGWGQHGDVTRQLITTVALRHDGEHPQIGRRFELVNELLREVVADVLEVRAEGDGELAQLLDLVLFGDYVALWMAAEAGVDPGPVPVLAELKAALDN